MDQKKFHEKMPSTSELFLCELFKGNYSIAPRQKNPIKPMIIIKMTKDLKVQEENRYVLAH